MIYAGVLGVAQTFFPPCIKTGEICHRCNPSTPESRLPSCSRSSQQRPHDGAHLLEMKPSWLAWWSPPHGVTLQSPRSQSKGQCGTPRPLTHCTEQCCRGMAQTAGPTSASADDLLGDICLISSYLY